MAEAGLLAVACAVSFACGVAGRALVGALAAAAVLVTLVVLDAGPVPSALAVAGPWAAGRVVRSRRRLVAELAVRNRELEAERATLERNAVERERARIARELHDIVAHHLAVMVLHAGAGRIAPADEETLRSRLESIGEAGALALAEMDRLVGLLADRGAGSRSVDDLVRQARAAGVRIAWTPLPDGVHVPPALEEGAYRVVQEGITNAIKHAPGAEIRVWIGVEGGELRVELSDPGTRSTESLARTGSQSGLAGMRERVEALGGAFAAGPREDGGWAVRARLPITPPG